MAVLLSILFFAILLGFVFLMRYLRRQAVRQLNQRVFARDRHQRGTSSTSEVIEFTAPQPAAVVVAELRDRLGLRTDAPAAFVAALYLAEQRPGALVFQFGNKVSRSFRSVFMSEDLPGGGSRSVYRVTNWVLSDGIVRGVDEMELLANTVRHVAVQLGGTYGVPSTSTPIVDANPASEPTPVALDAAPAACTACGSRELGPRFCTDCGAPVATAV